MFFDDEVRRLMDANYKERPAQRFRREYYEARAASRPAKTRAEHQLPGFNVNSFREAALLKASRFFRIA